MTIGRWTTAAVLEDIRNARVDLEQRERADLEAAALCQCGRSVPDRYYLVRWICRVCGRWVL